MSKLATLTGHTYRVLYLAISPDGQSQADLAMVNRPFWEASKVLCDAFQWS